MEKGEFARRNPQTKEKRHKTEHTTERTKIEVDLIICGNVFQKKKQCFSSKTCFDSSDGTHSLYMTKQKKRVKKFASKIKQVIKRRRNFQKIKERIQRKRKRNDDDSRTEEPSEQSIQFF